MIDAILKEHPAAQPAVQEPVAWMRNDGKRVTTAAYRHNYPDYETRYSIPLYTTPPAAQPAPVQEGRDWSLLEATQESLREHMAEIKRLKAAQPAPVQEPVASYCCHSCFKIAGGFMLDRMILCPECGNKRCPKASDHQLDCTGSNEPNQPGSVYTAPQPVPVKTYHDGKPWPVAPKPWVGLTDAEVEAYDDWADFQVGCGRQTLFDMVRDIDAKLKGKNT
jgi:DNA-directed RNA polymerase subunit RPC12/RpoP